MDPNKQFILLTIDVEDWFQVENFKDCIPFSSWGSYELRVEKNTHRLLDLFDSVRMNDRTSSIQHQLSGIHIRATFFILGWIAERLPGLVREIHSRGHEVASHGYNHELGSKCSLEGLRSDLILSRELLEDIVGDRIYGYRAPSFSVNNDILKIIEECGYLYDSSYNSFNMHGRYGHLDLSQNGKRGIAHQTSKTQNLKSKILLELPISNLKIVGNIFPWGGGGYFRLIPFPLFKTGVQSILKKDGAYLLYIHPWEIDPNQPRVKEASMFFKFRHYTNLSETYSRLTKIFQVFNQCLFISCHQYLEEMIEI